MTSPDGVNPGAALGNDMAFAVWQNLDEAAVTNRMKSPFIVSAQEVENQVNGQVKDPLNDTTIVGVDNSAAIAAIKSQLSAVGAGGSGATPSFNEPFDGSALNTTSSDPDGWTIFNPNSMSIYVVNGQCWVYSTTAGSAWIAHNAPTVGDDFDISIVVGDIYNGATLDSAIVFGANATMTTWGYINFYKSKFFIGWGSRAAGSATFTPHDWNNNSNNGTAAALTRGSSLRVTCVTVAGVPTYSVYLGAAKLLAYTDSSLTKPIGASYRYNGLRFRADVTSEYQSSAAVANFTVADLTPPTFVGTGWYLYRGAPGASGSVSANSSGAALASGTLDVQEAAPGVTVYDQGTGTIQIEKAGWYAISASLNFNLARPTAGVGLHKGTSSTPTTPVRAGMLSAPTDGSQRVDGSWVVYCNIGEYVRPAVILASGSTTILGTGGGSITYFSGALISS